MKKQKREAIGFFFRNSETDNSFSYAPASAYKATPVFRVSYMTSENRLSSYHQYKKITFKNAKLAFLK